MFTIKSALKRVILFLLVLSFSNLFATIQPFSVINPDNTKNVRGNYAIAGNTVMCLTEKTSGYGGTCHGMTDYELKTSNNRVSKYIDIDSDSSTWNASSSYITIPSSFDFDNKPNKGILWAGLFWQGRISKDIRYEMHYGKENGSSFELIETGRGAFYRTIDLVSAGAKNIKLKVDTGSYSDVLADTFYEYSSSNGVTYAAFSDVTDLLKSSITTDGKHVFTVANLTTNEGREKTPGLFGGWSIVVIYAEDISGKMRNISVFSGFDIVKKPSKAFIVDNFLLPRSGDIHSSLSLFAGEGEYLYGYRPGRENKYDWVKISDDGIHYDYMPGAAHDKNIFDATFTGITRDDITGHSNNLQINNNGVDIDNFDVSSLMTSYRDENKNINKMYIQWSSNNDYVTPSMITFATELYEPRICYKQEFLDEDGNALADIHVGDTIMVNTWISNMKKDATDGNLETADKVEITLELDSENLEYVSQSTKIQNIGQSVYTPKTDAQGDDTADYFSDINSSKWRIGVGANKTDGGTLIPNATDDDNKKVYITFKTKLLKQGDININNVYKVSYEDSLLGVRFGDESPINIGICKDMNTTIGVGGALGKFSIVNNNFTTPYIASDDKSNAQNALYTQVVGRSFDVTVLSLNEAKNNLLSYSGDLNISLIQTPDYEACNDDEVCKQNKCDSKMPISDMPIKSISFNNNTQKSVNLTYNKAFKNVSFKITYAKGKHACSIDSFAIRPKKFNLNTPTGEDIDLLTSAKDYSFSLIAENESNSPSSGYTVLNADNMLDLNKTIYNSDGTDGTTILNGALAFSTAGFNIVDGSALNVVGMNFTDVGKVNVKLIDKKWAQVDISNGDTVADCSETGAWICGDINATFIPDHFILNNVEVHNENDSTFTYLSNDLDMSAHISMKIEAKNAKDNTTQNFDKNSWENPVDINFSVPVVATMTSHKDEVDETLSLGFTSGSITIPWSENNSSKKLMFNFLRDTNNTKNPFVINGSDIDITAKSTYKTKDVTGTNTATEKVTFVYGRSHAPRHRFTDNTNQEVFIYYEVYCDDLAKKALLPNGATSTFTDDPRWFINTLHTDASGTAGTVSQKGTAGTVRVETQPTGKHQDKTSISYNGNKGNPYKTTMQNSASSWLIYNKYDINNATTKNEFEVEFEGKDSNWIGKHETNTTTIKSGSDKTNRRIMW